MHGLDSWANASKAWTGAVTAYWKALYHNFSRHGDGREKLLYDYSLDEPTSNCVERKFANGTFNRWDCRLHWAQIKARAAALHAVDPDLRSLVTTELCDTGRFPPLSLRFSIEKCRNCPFLRAF